MPNLMTACRQPGENFEQVDLCSAGMRICEVLPVDDEDIHAEESKDWKSLRCTPREAIAARANERPRRVPRSRSWPRERLRTSEPA